jgi:uncharacterized protein
MTNFYSRFQIISGAIMLLLMVTLVGCAHEPVFKPKKLLVVTVTKGYKHESIPTAEKVIEELGNLNQSFTVEYARTDEDLATKMTPQGLQKYDGVVFASTTGDLPLPDRIAFLNWIKEGHAFIGVHAATDTFLGYEPYIEMIGGEFAGHGPQLKVTLNSLDSDHAATKHFSKTYEIFDEIYTFKNFQQGMVRVLLSVDKNPNKNDKANFDQPGFYPLAWCRSYGKGRVFYTALGHREDVLLSESFKQHLLGGINWAFKQAKGSDQPQE